jgi:hypothetical protein
MPVMIWGLGAGVSGKAVLGCERCGGVYHVHVGSSEVA